MTIIETMIVCVVFIVEFWIKDFSKQLPIMGTMVVITLIFLILISVVADKTQKEVEILIDSMEKKKKNDINDMKK